MLYYKVKVIFTVVTYIGIIVWFRVYFGEKHARVFQTLSKTHDCMFFQIAQETILLLINNVYMKKYTVTCMAGF
jgi:hypothetical protein